MTPDRLLPDADDFIAAWLVRGDASPNYTTFQHVPLDEKEDTRDAVLVPLAKTVFVHHNDPEEFRRNLEFLGYPEIAAILDRRPRTPNTRKGNLGEILAAEYLRQSEGYQIPVYRLRYNPNPESSMKGDDVLAFKFGEPDGTGREVVVVEAKVRNRFENRVVTLACDQLESGHRPRPTSILFIITILRKEKRDDEAHKVLAFLDKFAPNQPTRRKVLFLVTGNRPRDPFRSIQEREEAIENLLAVNVCVPNLDGLVEVLFDYEVRADGS